VSRPARFVALVLTAVLAGCAAAPPPAPARSPDAEELVPAGFGTLRQENVTLTIRSGSLLIKVTPLEEWVIRLTAPDTHRRLGELSAQHRPVVEERTRTRGPRLFLVSFFASVPDTPFHPDDLQLVNRGRTYRPLLVRGITSGWGIQRLGSQETQTAVYAFDPGVDLRLDLGVEYGEARSGEWSRILEALEAERARVRARAARGRAPAPRVRTPQESSPYFLILR